MELGLTSLWMRRPSGQLPSQPRDAREVVLVYGKASIPLLVTSMRKAGQARCQNQMNQAEECVGDWGLEQEMCEWGPGEQCFPGLGEGGSERGHLPWAGEWGDGTIQFFQGEHKERKREKVHRVQQGKFL